MNQDLFTWINFKKFIVELIKTWSSKPSYFSQKRVNSSIAFTTFIIGAFYTLFKYVASVADFAIWGGVLTPFILYSLYKIQKAKTDENGEDKV